MLLKMNKLRAYRANVQRGLSFFINVQTVLKRINLLALTYQTTFVIHACTHSTIISLHQNSIAYTLTDGSNCSSVDVSMFTRIYLIGVSRGSKTNQCAKTECGDLQKPVNLYLYKKYTYLYLK